MSQSQKKINLDNKSLKNKIYYSKDADKSYQIYNCLTKKLQSLNNYKLKFRKYKLPYKKLGLRLI